MAVLAHNYGVALCVPISYVYLRNGTPLAHLYLGQGLPSVLRVSLGALEGLSVLFRPISLSLRVVCNSLAGHLLLSVLLDMVCTSYPLI